jgi:hypothetical protein
MLEVTPKDYLISWWIIAILSVFLWYRNKNEDRIFSIVFFLLGIIQLIQYSVYSGADAAQAGKAIYITIWLQVVILTISVFIYFDSTNVYEENRLLYIFSFVTMIFFFVVFVLALSLLLTSEEDKYLVFKDADGSITWQNKDNNNFLGLYWWIYLLGIIAVIIMLWFNDPDKYTILIIIIICYNIFVLSQIFYSCPTPTMSKNLASDYSYCAIFYIFIVWIANMY